MLPVAVIGGVLKGIFGIGEGWLSNKKAKAKAVHKVEMAILENKQRLAVDVHSHNSAKEMMMLQVASPWVRWIIVFHVLALFDVCIVNPEYGERVFAALGTMPDWAVGLYMVMFGFYFAVTALMKTGGSLVSGWRKSPKSAVSSGDTASPSK